jgi:hypothetical protein
MNGWNQSSGHFFVTKLLNDNKKWLEPSFQPFNIIFRGVRLSLVFIVISAPEGKNGFANL